EMAVVVGHLLRGEQTPAVRIDDPPLVLRHVLGAHHPPLPGRIVARRQGAGTTLASGTTFPSRSSGASSPAGTTTGRSPLASTACLACIPSRPAPRGAVLRRHGGAAGRPEGDLQQEQHGKDRQA